MVVQHRVTELYYAVAIRTEVKPATVAFVVVDLAGPTNRTRTLTPAAAHRITSGLSLVRKRRQATPGRPSGAS